MKLGNAGGAKDPDFGYASEDGEVKVIGDEPANTDYDPGPSSGCHCRRLGSGSLQDAVSSDAQKGLGFVFGYQVLTAWDVAERKLRGEI